MCSFGMVMFFSIAQDFNQDPWPASKAGVGLPEVSAERTK